MTMGIDAGPENWMDDVPETGELFAYVWWCGDECCDCTQAQIVLIEERNRYGGWAKARTLWNGEYRCEDYSASPHTELNREARRVKKKSRELFHRISWPWDRKEK